MARKRSAWEQIRRYLYFTQRTMSDVSAARRGTLAKRVVRRRVTRAVLRAWR